MQRTVQRALLALALISTAGVSYAQTMQTNEPRDPYGRPFVGRNDWVRQPGDERGPAAGGANMNTNQNMAAAPMSMPAQSGPHQATFKDEYGFRYDAQGNRLDARGNVISPHTK